MAMAMWMKRVISSSSSSSSSSRSASYILLKNTSVIAQTRCISHFLFCNSSGPLCNPRTQNSIKSTAFSPPTASLGFLKQTHRGLAKAKKSNGSSGSTAEAIDIGPLKASTASQMEAALEALSRELTKLRSGRASPGMLDHIIVETEGVKMPLNRIAVVSVMDSKTLSVNPYDPNTLKVLEKAIALSPLGLRTRAEAERVVVSVPPLTKESVQAICKVVAKSSEDVKQSVRRARQKAMDTIKKSSSSIPKDTAKRLEKEIDDMTKKFIKSAEDMCKAKEKEITEG